MHELIFHELGHSAVARHLGHSLNRFQVQRIGEDDYQGECRPAFNDETPFPHAVGTAFAGPLAEIRYRGDGREIDFDKSFVGLAVANMKLATRIYFSGGGPPLDVERGAFSDDWNLAWQKVNQAKEVWPEVIPLEQFLGCLRNTIKLVNTGPLYNAIQDVAQKIASHEPVLALAVGGELDLFPQVNDWLGVHFQAPQQPNNAG